MDQNRLNKFDINGPQLEPIVGVRWKSTWIPPLHISNRSRHQQTHFCYYGSNWNNILFRIYSRIDTNTVCVSSIIPLQKSFIANLVNRFGLKLKLVFKCRWNELSISFTRWLTFGAVSSTVCWICTYYYYFISTYFIY